MTASSFRSRSCLSVEVYRPQIRLLHFCVDGRVGQRGNGNIVGPTKLFTRKSHEHEDDPAATPATELYFTAVPNHDSGGLFGYLTAVSTQLVQGNDQ
jgi:hypothetical protein